MDHERPKPDTSSEPVQITGVLDEAELRGLWYAVSLTLAHEAEASLL
jgi:hypothetical protein